MFQDSSNKTSHKVDLEGLECKTDKSKQAANKHRSAEIFCAVYKCGIVVGITELFGSKSLSHVYFFLTWLWQTILLFPMLLAYDDACHLKRFVNRRQNTISGKFLATLIMVVYKMHFKNHVDKWCKQNLNPHKVAAFNSLNTEAYEQTFNYISKLKHAT
ncbi:unnamed protein product [Mytilus coruscus]|uniref:Uncharacterized protein n=1 Tax=Mytilus coruscus TaxID=42192 RepID=A0A6J8A1F1_MYTCO|nr:unnamed protein product [Mytilus coruscus]